MQRKITKHFIILHFQSIKGQYNLNLFILHLQIFKNIHIFLYISVTHVMYSMMFYYNEN